MNKTTIIGFVAIVLLLGAGLTGVMALSNNRDQNAAAQQESSEGLSNEEIRDGLINHGADHTDGDH